MANEREAQFLELVREYPDSPMGYFSLGKLYLDEKRYTDAGTPLEADAGSDAGTDAGADAGAATLSVLFIGNSYTYVNDLPGMLQQIAATAKAPPLISTEQVTVGGAALVDHWFGPNAQ